jgi:hypothetical protein
MKEMERAILQALRYSLRYAGHAAGEQRLTLEPRRDGLRVVLEANVELPLPKTRQRWESELDHQGLPRRYRERVEDHGTRVMEVAFSREDGLVVVSQGKEDLALPYLSETHDPLSLILAVGALNIEVGQVEKFALVGGRAYVERLPDQTIELGVEGQKKAQSVRVYRLRPGLSLLYFDQEGYPVRLTQKVGEHVFEADLIEVQRLEGGAPQEAVLPSSSRPRAVSGARRAPRRRRRRYS